MAFLSTAKYVLIGISLCVELISCPGANRYFTLCSTDFLALGGGGHFALYLDGDLLVSCSFLRSSSYSIKHVSSFH